MLLTIGALNQTAHLFFADGLSFAQLKHDGEEDRPKGEELGEHDLLAGSVPSRAANSRPARRHHSLRPTPALSAAASTRAYSTSVSLVPSERGRSGFTSFSLSNCGSQRGTGIP